MNKNNDIAYVNAVLFSDDGESLVFLKKLTGPEFLIGKYNFIGGKQELGESHLEAIIREVKEEAGLDVPVDKFYSIDYREFEKDGKFYKLENFAAVVPSELLKQARTVEHEPVYHLSFNKLMTMLGDKNESFNYDFKTLLIMALDNVPKELDNPRFGELSYALNSMDKEPSKSFKM